MAIKLVMTAEAMQDEKAWLALRNNYIGGSDAASVIGLNKWKSPYQLWLEKTNQVQPADLSSNMKVWFGKRAEEMVAERFTLDEKKKVRRTGVYVNDKYPWACASIDRMLVGENSFLECKTSSGFTKDQWSEGEIPDNYYIQVLHYMTIMEMQYCYIACLFDNCSDYIVRKVDFNQKDAEALMKAEKTFYYNNIVEGKEPALDGSLSCTEAITNRYKGGIDEAIEIQKAEEYAKKLEELEEIEKNIKLSKAEYQNNIKNLLGDNENGFSQNYKFSWKTIAGRKTIDSKLLQKEQPAIYKQYLKEGSQTRRFSFKHI